MHSLFSLRKVVFLFVLIGCGKHTNLTDHTALMNSGSGGTIIDNGNTQSPPTNFKPEICSDLSFEFVNWPKGTDQTTATLFALAMNITGSFEGHEGWDNISNNFDGQGMSLGLFNQNFGQGSLQPLLINMRVEAEQKMKTLFTSTQLSSLETMLATWNGGSISVIASKAVKTSTPKISPLDDPALLEKAGELSLVTEKASSTRNQQSVDWAVQNIYTGSTFKTDWKTSFQSLSNTPEYISFQVEAAKDIHNDAIKYMQKFDFKELRAYLFLFDIVVQNGSLTSSVEANYTNWVKTNGAATETVKLQKLLEYRLALVKAEYVNDVRARKTAVILGTGTVHGSKRDFRTEYCAPSWSTAYLDKPVLY